MEKISVIIATFNAAPIIRNAIESVLAQQYNSLELIIVDGGSTDGTLEIIHSFGANISCCISEPDKGIYDAMNKGIAASSGTWLIFLGADDSLCKGVLNELFSVPAFYSPGIIYGKVLLDESKKMSGNQSDFNSLIADNIPHQAIFYHRHTMQQFNGYNLYYKILADYDLNLKIFENPSIKKTFIDKPVAVYHTRGISNRTIDYLFFTEKKDYFINNRGLSKKDKRLAKYYFFCGVAQVLKKNRLQGFKNIANAIQYSDRWMYYFLLTVNFIFTLLGIGRKYKYV